MRGDEKGKKSLLNVIPGVGSCVPPEGTSRGPDACYAFAYSVALGFCKGSFSAPTAVGGIAALLASSHQKPYPDTTIKKFRGFLSCRKHVDKRQKHVENPPKSVDNQTWLHVDNST